MEERLTFGDELDQLIAKHLGKPQRGDDFMPVIDALCNAGDKLAMLADRRRYSDESEAEFAERLARLEGSLAALGKPWS